LLQPHCAKTPAGLPSRLLGCWMKRTILAQMTPGLSSEVDKARLRFIHFFCRWARLNPMRLVTFENPAKQSRIGAVSAGDGIVDLNSACALYLRDVESEGAFYRLADALVPADMRQLFEGGDTSLEAAHKAFDYALHHGADGVGPRGEPIF